MTHEKFLHLLGLCVDALSLSVSCCVQDILKSLQDVLKIRQMKHFVLVVRTAMSKRFNKMSLLRNSDSLHEVCNRHLHCVIVYLYMQTNPNKLCGRPLCTICPRPSPPSVGAEAPRATKPTAPADGNVAVGSHAQYVPTLTAAAA